MIETLALRTGTATTPLRMHHQAAHDRRASRRVWRAIVTRFLAAPRAPAPSGPKMRPATKCPGGACG